MEGGFITLHRKFLSWEWFEDSGMVKFFIFLLLSANHAPKKYRGMLIERGQLTTSREALANQTNLSVQTVRTYIERLKSTGEITVQTTNRFTKITICKYDTYQSEKILNDQQINQRTNQQLTNNQPTTNQQLTTNNNVNNDNNEIIDNINNNDNIARTRRGFKIPKSENEMLTTDHLIGLLTDSDFNRMQLEGLAMMFRIEIKRIAEIIDKEFKLTMQSKGMLGNTLKDGRDHLFKWFVDYHVREGQKTTTSRVSTLHFDGEKKTKLKIS